MLILTRSFEEKIRIGGTVKVIILQLRNDGEVRKGIWRTRERIIKNNEKLDVKRECKKTRQKKGVTK